MNPFPGDTLAALGATRGPTTTEIGAYRVRVSPQPGGQVRVTALSLEGYHATTDALRRTLLIGGLIIVMLEAAMAWWLAGRLVRPLATMAATANQIADGALDTEVVTPGGPARSPTSRPTSSGWSPGCEPLSPSASSPRRKPPGPVTT